MSISHDDILIPPGTMVVFAELMGVSCSVCAPKHVTVEEVLAFATKECPPRAEGWVAVDKSKIGLGLPTPNPCNRYPERTHWLLFDEFSVAQFGGRENVQVGKATDGGG